MASESFRSLIAGWASTQKLITKNVEFIHRDNGAAARAKGPAKPSDVYTVADNLIVTRCQKFHAEALAKR